TPPRRSPPPSLHDALPIFGDVYLQTSGCTAEFNAGTYYALDSNAGNLKLHQKDCATAALIYQFRTHIYFVANNDKPGDGIPTLRSEEHTSELQSPDHLVSR